MYYNVRTLYYHIMCSRRLTLFRFVLRNASWRNSQCACAVVIVMEIWKIHDESEVWNLRVTTPLLVLFSSLFFPPFLGCAQRALTKIIIYSIIVINNNYTSVTANKNICTVINNIMIKTTIIIPNGNVCLAIDLCHDTFENIMRYRATRYWIRTNKISVATGRMYNYILRPNA